MQSDGLKWLKLDDPDQGEILLMVPIPHDGDPWGSLAVLRGTIWESLITVVTGAAMSDAMHGWATGLVRTIGIQPKYRRKRVSDDDGLCKLYEDCALATIHCHPRDQFPDCYEAPLDDPEAAMMAAQVAMAWREGRYVVVVEGKEWSL
jgi:hypothetical protein